MKTLMIVLVGMVMSLNAWAQGVVNFSTYVIGVKIYRSDTLEPLSGWDYLAQLYFYNGITTSSSDLSPVGVPVNFYTDELAGYVRTSGVNSLGQTITQYVTLLDPMTQGTKVTLQMRVWKGGSVASYEAAMLEGHITGASSLFTEDLYPGMAVNLLGLKGFRFPQLIDDPHYGLAIIEFHLSAPNQLTISWQGVPGYSYQILTSGSLSGPWSYLGEKVTIHSNVYQTTIDITNNVSAAFYRVMLCD
jgi:hypothetical protein